MSRIYFNVIFIFLSVYLFGQPGCRTPTESFIRILYGKPSWRDSLEKNEFMIVGSILHNSGNRSSFIDIPTDNELIKEEYSLKIKTDKSDILLVIKNPNKFPFSGYLIKSLPKKSGTYVINLSRSIEVNFLNICFYDITPNNWTEFDLIKENKPCIYPIQAEDRYLAVSFIKRDSIIYRLNMDSSSSTINFQIGRYQFYGISDMYHPVEMKQFRYIFRQDTMNFKIILPYGINYTIDSVPFENGDFEIECDLSPFDNDTNYRAISQIIYGGPNRASLNSLTEYYHKASGVNFSNEWKKLIAKEDFVNPFENLQYCTPSENKIGLATNEIPEKIFGQSYIKVNIIKINRLK